MYSPIFLARSQPGFSLVYLKSIQKKPNLHKIIWMYDGPHLLCLKINTKIHQGKWSQMKGIHHWQKKFKLSRHPKVSIHTRKRKLFQSLISSHSWKNSKILEMEKPVIELNEMLCFYEFLHAFMLKSTFGSSWFPEDSAAKASFRCNIDTLSVLLKPHTAYKMQSWCNEWHLSKKS